MSIGPDPAGVLKMQGPGSTGSRPSRKNAAFVLLPAGDNPHSALAPDVIASPCLAFEDNRRLALRHHHRVSLNMNDKVHKAVAVHVTFLDDGGYAVSLQLHRCTCHCHPGGGHQGWGAKSNCTQKCPPGGAVGTQVGRPFGCSPFECN